MSLVKNRMSICNFVCILLLVAIIAVQLCVPFYTYHNEYKPDGAKKKVKEISTVSYGMAVWFAGDDYYESLVNHFKSKDMFGEIDKHGNEYGKVNGRKLKFNPDEMAYPHMYTVILAGFSIALFLMKRKSFMPSALSLAAGIITTKAFLTNRTIVLGGLYANRVVSDPRVCTINVVLGAVLICVAAFSLFGGFILNPLAKKKAAKKAAKAAKAAEA